MSSPQAGNSTTQKASWLGLPRKGQLLLLFLCRVLDFMQMATFQIICYYQLKSFTTSSISETTLSWQTGIAIGAFTAAQVCTSVFWGVCADKKWCGRKPVLLIGLTGTALSCVASAFARSFYQMVAFRIVGGLLNGTVGIVRTMLSENIVEKRFQSRAFSLLSLSFNVASFLGPLIAGFLSNPLKVKYSLKEGSTNLLDRYPYASPLLINAGAIFLLTVVVSLYLEETAKSLRGDVFRLFRYKILTFLGVQRNSHYNALRTEDTEANDLREFSVSSPTVHSHEGKSGARGVSIWTFTFLMTLASQSIFDLHMGAYTGLWPLFLSNPRENTDNVSTSKSGGLGLPIEDVGVATSIAGVIGMFIQILIYPQINDIIGVVNSYRYFSCLFPIAYFALPLLGLIAETATVSIWVAIFFTLMIHVTGRVFVIPATLIILNNSAASPELLGKVHGIGQMASSVFRTLGPIFAGYLFEAGLELQSIFFAWWVVGGLAVVGFGAAQYVRDGPVTSAPTQEAND